MQGELGPLTPEAAKALDLWRLWAVWPEMPGAEATIAGSVKPIGAACELLRWHGRRSERVGIKEVVQDVTLVEERLGWFSDLQRVRIWKAEQASRIGNWDRVDHAGLMDELTGVWHPWGAGATAKYRGEFWRFVEGIPEHGVGEETREAPSEVVKGTGREPRWAGLR